jgi:hypothetical protein
VKWKGNIVGDRKGSVGKWSWKEEEKRLEEIKQNLWKIKYKVVAK